MLLLTMVFSFVGYAPTVVDEAIEYFDGMRSIADAQLLTGRMDMFNNAFSQQANELQDIFRQDIQSFGSILTSVAEENAEIIANNLENLGKIFKNTELLTVIRSDIVCFCRIFTNPISRDLLLDFPTDFVKLYPYQWIRDAMIYVPSDFEKIIRTSLRKTIIRYPQFFQTLVESKTSREAIANDPQTFDRLSRIIKDSEKESVVYNSETFFTLFALMKGVEFRALKVLVEMLTNDLAMIAVTSYPKEFCIFFMSYTERAAIRTCSRAFATEKNYLKQFQQNCLSFKTLFSRILSNAASREKIIAIAQSLQIIPRLFDETPIGGLDCLSKIRECLEGPPMHNLNVTDAEVAAFLEDPLRFGLDIAEAHPDPSNEPESH